MDLFNQQLEPDEEEDPGAYPIPFHTARVQLGSRLDSISASLRFWAVDEERSHNRWHAEMVQANERYEEWLATRPPGDYPVPIKFDDARTIKDVGDGERHWATSPACSRKPWYPYFARANQRYERHLVETHGPGKFPIPPGILRREYAGMLLEDVPQDRIWWALRPSNRGHPLYQTLYEANRRYLDDKYTSRSPGSEPIWFGKRYKGLRLDQVYERKGFMAWCYDPERGEGGWICRLKDLVRRLQEWREAHPERRRPRRQRKARHVENPTGELLGEWDDSAGSADEDDEYETGSFVQSDSDEVEFEDDVEEELSGEDDSAGESDPNGSTSSSAVMSPRKRKLVLMSSDSEGSVEPEPAARRLGRRYRVARDSSEEEEEEG